MKGQLLAKHCSRLTTGQSKSTQGTGVSKIGSDTLCSVTSQPPVLSVTRDELRTRSDSSVTKIDKQKEAGIDSKYMPDQAQKIEKHMMPAASNRRVSDIEVRLLLLPMLCVCTDAGCLPIYRVNLLLSHCIRYQQL